MVQDLFGLVGLGEQDLFGLVGLGEQDLFGHVGIGEVCGYCLKFWYVVNILWGD